MSECEELGKLKLEGASIQFLDHGRIKSRNIHELFTSEIFYRF